jgi:hypothetical protein
MPNAPPGVGRAMLPLFLQDTYRNDRMSHCNTSTRAALPTCQYVRDGGGGSHRMSSVQWRNYCCCVFAVLHISTSFRCHDDDGDNASSCECMDGRMPQQPRQVTNVDLAL